MLQNDIYKDHQSLKDGELDIFLRLVFKTFDENQNRWAFEDTQWNETIETVIKLSERANDIDYMC